MVDDLQSNFQNTIFDQVPRAQNRAADAMATIRSLLNIRSDSLGYEFLVEQLLQPAFETSHTDMVCNIVGPQSPWYCDIHAYLKFGTLHENISRNDCQNLICRCARFTLIADKLYHCGYHDILCRCLDSNEAKLAMQEVHASTL